MPPRSISAWLLGHEPTSKMICASYGQDLADKHARDCRTLVGSEFYRMRASAKLGHSAPRKRCSAAE